MSHWTTENKKVSRHEPDGSGSERDVIESPFAFHYFAFYALLIKYFCTSFVACLFIPRPGRTSSIYALWRVLRLDIVFRRRESVFQDW